MGAITDERFAVRFGRYDDRGRLVETVVGQVDPDTGRLHEAVWLVPGTWLVLWPGGLLCQTPLIVTRASRFDQLVPTP